MRRWSIALFRLFGIQLEVHVTFLLLLVYVGVDGWRDGGVAGLASAVVLVVTVFVCVVLHELGHSLVAQRFGIRVPRILLLPIGGMAQFDSIPRQPYREFLIAIAGPAVNFALVVLLLTVIGWPDWDNQEIAYPVSLGTFAGLLLLMNLVMGVFNLLPAFPMDGGRILRAFLAMRFNYVTATRWAARIGQAIALVACAAALASSAWFHANLWIAALLFAFIFYGAEMELRFVSRSDLYSGLRVGDVTRRDFRALPDGASIADAIAAARLTQPQDILLVANGVPVGILTRDALAAAARAGRHDDPAASHAQRRFAALQAEWPLVPFATDLIRTGQTLFPVYSYGVFVGVLDARHLDETVRLLKRSKHEN